MTGDDRVTDEMVKRSHQVVDDVLDMALYLRNCSPENIGRYQDAANRLAHFMDEVRAALSAALKAKRPVATGWDPITKLENGTIALDDDMKPYRVTASPARSDQPVAVTVKPLEWEVREDGSYRGASTIGYYHVFQGTGFSYDLCGPVGGRLATHKRLESAKASAQQDYETRIRSAIVEVPAEPEFWTSHNNLENLSMVGKGVALDEGSDVWDFAGQEWVPADIPLYTSQPLSRQGGDNDTIERVSTGAAMSQWERSLKRPDLSEKDRVRGAIEAYKRQAFAFAVLSPTRTASSADGSATSSKGAAE